MDKEVAFVVSIQAESVARVVVLWEKYLSRFSTRETLNVRRQIIWSAMKNNRNFISIWNAKMRSTIRTEAGSE